MIGYYRRKWSASARWCQRLAVFCLPYFGIAILLHRADRITTPQAYWLIGIGLGIVMTSLILGVRAFFELWNSGRRGGKATLRGMLLSLALLAPYAWWAYLGIIHPALSDISTNPVTPPAFSDAAQLRREKADQGINPLADYDVAYAGKIAEAYPRLASRRYNSGAERILDATRSLFEARGWEISSIRGRPEGQESDSPASAEESAESGVAGELVGELPGDIYVEGVARSLVFGFRQDVVIAIFSEAESTLVDMRASTRWGSHDFGRNARTITEFLGDLDKALVGIAGEG